MADIVATLPVAAAPDAATAAAIPMMTLQGAIQGAAITAVPDATATMPVMLQGAVPGAAYAQMTGAMPTATMPAMQVAAAGAVPGAGMQTIMVPATAMPGAEAVAGASPVQWQGPYLDAATGRYYYYNPWTQQSSWASTPGAPDAATAAAAALGVGGVAGAMQAAVPVQAMHGLQMMPMYGYLPQMAAAYAGAGLTGALSGGGGASLMKSDGECGDFKRGKCDRGDTCKYLHVKPTQECRDFKAGRCSRGATCKFLHDNEVAHHQLPGTCGMPGLGVISGALAGPGGLGAAGLASLGLTPGIFTPGGGAVPHMPGLQMPEAAGRERSRSRGREVET